VPEAASGRGIRVETGDGKALGAGGSSGPGKVRRLVATRATKAEISRQDVCSSP
jgi:hypothetical protein